MSRWPPNQRLFRYDGGCNDNGAVVSDQACRDRWRRLGRLADCGRHRRRPSRGARSGLQVTLIESPDVGPIGVGEGTWPTMRDTLRRIGVSESDFLRECDASFKQGSRFDGWRDGQEQRLLLPSLRSAARLHGDEPGRRLAAASRQRAVRRPGRVSSLTCARRARRRSRPRRPNIAAVANYAYHLDAGKFGSVPAQALYERLGVRQRARSRGRHRNRIANGDIAALQTSGAAACSKATCSSTAPGCNRCCSASTRRAVRVAEARAVQRHARWRMQVPYPTDDAPIASQTISTAQSRRLDLGHRPADAPRHRLRVLERAQQRRRGRSGSCAHYVERATGRRPDCRAAQDHASSPDTAREFWHRNCVAIGLSAGFIEPLEASALALVELSAAMLSDEMPATREAMDIVARRFNDSFTYRWERVIDFLKLHYVLSRRRTAAYWHENRDTGHRSRPAARPARAVAAPAALRVTTCTAWKKCSRRPATSTCCTAWAFGRAEPSRRRSDDAERADNFREAAHLTAQDAGGAALESRAASTTSGDTDCRAYGARRTTPC